MDSDLDSKKIMDALELKKLQDEYEEELRKYHKNQIIATVIKKCNVDEIKEMSDENKENIKEAINHLHLIEYVKMENTGLTALGILPKPKELSYIEKKALRNQILEDLPKFYQPQLDFINSVSKDVFRRHEIEKELIDLEIKNQELKKQLLELKSEHCDLLKECVNLKFGPNQKNSAEFTQLNVRIENTKALIMKDLMVDSICNKTEHALKAMKTLQKYVDEELVSKDMI